MFRAVVLPWVACCLRRLRGASICVGVVGVGVVCSAAVAQAQAVTEVTYPAPESTADVRYADLVELLHVALEHTKAAYGPYRLHPASASMSEARQLVALQHGTDLSVVWSSTDVEKERALLPIRIPLRKGLLGYRIALIARDAQAQLDKVQTAEDLRRLVIGQGIGWGDVALYEQDGFNVVTSYYDSLFPMVAAHRFDLFPRGVGEVYKEFAKRSASIPNLAVEQHLLIYYPWPYYFFCNRQDTALAARIEAGLRAAIKDGTFEAIFRKYYAADIRLADFKHRRVIRLNNPRLPKATPLNDPSLWFNPATDL